MCDQLTSGRARVEDEVGETTEDEKDKDEEAEKEEEEEEEEEGERASESGDEATVKLRQSIESSVDSIGRSDREEESDILLSAVLLQHEDRKLQDSKQALNLERAEEEESNQIGSSGELEGTREEKRQRSESESGERKMVGGGNSSFASCQLAPSTSSERELFTTTNWFNHCHAQEPIRTCCSFQQASQQDNSQQPAKRQAPIRTRGFSECRETKLAFASKRMRQYFESTFKRGRQVERHSANGRQASSMYQFFKSTRTELVACLLMCLMVSQARITCRAFGVLESGNLNDNLVASAELRCHLISGLVAAFGVATLTQIFGHISGCHLLPSVSWALYVKGHISRARLVSYLSAQSLGALLGVGLLAALTSSQVDPAVRQQATTHSPPQMQDFARQQHRSLSHLVAKTTPDYHQPGSVPQAFQNTAPARLLSAGGGGGGGAQVAQGNKRRRRAIQTTAKTTTTTTEAAAAAADTVALAATPTTSTTTPPTASKLEEMRSVEDSHGGLLDVQMSNHLKENNFAYQTGSGKRAIVASPKPLDRRGHNDELEFEAKNLDAIQGSETILLSIMEQQQRRRRIQDKQFPPNQLDETQRQPPPRHTRANDKLPTGEPAPGEFMNNLGQPPAVAPSQAGHTIPTSEPVQSGKTINGTSAQNASAPREPPPPPPPLPPPPPHRPDPNRRALVLVPLNSDAIQSSDYLPQLPLAPITDHLSSSECSDGIRHEISLRNSHKQREIHETGSGGDQPTRLPTASSLSRESSDDHSEYLLASLVTPTTQLRASELELNLTALQNEWPTTTRPSQTSMSNFMRVSPTTKLKRKKRTKAVEQPSNSLEEYHESGMKTINLLSYALPSTIMSTKSAYKCLESWKNNSSIANGQSIRCIYLSNESQMFIYQFLATSIVVLIYLVNVDPRRTDLGFKSLSIGLAYFLAHLLTIQSGGFYGNPTHLLALYWFSTDRLIVAESTNSFSGFEWRSEWFIYLLLPVVGGLFGALSHEYIDFQPQKGRSLHLRRSFYSLDELSSKTNSGPQQGALEDNNNSDKSSDSCVVISEEPAQQTGQLAKFAKDKAHLGGTIAQGDRKSSRLARKSLEQSSASSSSLNSTGARSSVLTLEQIGMEFNLAPNLHTNQQQSNCNGTSGPQTTANTSLATLRDSANLDSNSSLALQANGRANAKIGHIGHQTRRSSASSGDHFQAASDSNFLIGYNQSAQPSTSLRQQTGSRKALNQHAPLAQTSLQYCTSKFM